MPGAVANVFISHRTPDKPAAERLGQELRGRGHVVWFDTWDIKVGDSIVAAQLGGHGIKVLPVRLTGGQPPAILRDIRYADLVTDWAKGVDDLCAALR